ncbi:COP9 signalosome complex subunit 7 [Aspergillus awamori]|uniref:COP9 signalosome complex subunit 7 n=1 Tax=Aspergillus awamori TaxID=105351 RepID=A0A401L4M0_ASPAW|nr:COP9 signalosome complex subunit 7 [Aspergillus awamori]GKZ55180.1 hypothetical protein AnigIFM49718_011540 [Aspergillus niger]GLA39241.1 hypothetical protein AnigIFM63309_006578 [Aspergillus niger]
MDQIHTRALEALQPFIHLATSNSATSPRFITNLITNATSNPHTYVFAELLTTPAIQSLRDPNTPAEYASYLTLLEIFAWGTWQDYQSTPNLPPLNDAQTLKLRLLSLLSLSTTTNPLTYNTLMTALSITQPSELESLVTKAIYASLITARLSPASNPPTVNVTSVAPLRDVKPESLGKMIDILTAWETRCGDVIGDIEAEIVRIKTESARRRAEEREKEVLFEKALAGWGAKMDEKKVGGGGGGWQQGGRGGGVIGGNKREFAADELDDDGYWEYGLEGGDGMGGGGSRMDIDDGAGARLGGASSGPARHPKRVLGKKS